MSSLGKQNISRQRQPIWVAALIKAIKVYFHNMDGNVPNFRDTESG